MCDLQGCEKRSEKDVEVKDSIQVVVVTVFELFC